MSKDDAINMQMFINMVNIVWKHLSNIEQVLEKIIFGKKCANTGQILGKYGQILSKCLINSVQILGKY